MDANLQDLDSITVCRTLRQHRAVSWHTPIFMITSTPATKQQRLAALEAGAWDYLSLVINSEELALKLDAFVRVKLETDRALEEAAVEPASGLYTMRGLERRAPSSCRTRSAVTRRSPAWRSRSSWSRKTPVPRRSRPHRWRSRTPGRPSRRAVARPTRSAASAGTSSPCSLPPQRRTGQ